jgi:DivIVA domain-containing protein
MRLLTPQDIHEKKFSVHRFREGYDIDEVDEFMEDMEHTAKQLGDVGVGLLEMIQRRWSGNEDKKHQAGVLAQP